MNFEGEFLDSLLVRGFDKVYEFAIERIVGNTKGTTYRTRSNRFYALQAREPTYGNPIAWATP